MSIQARFTRTALKNDQQTTTTTTTTTTTPPLLWNNTANCNRFFSYINQILTLRHCRYSICEKLNLLCFLSLQNMLFSFNLRSFCFHSQGGLTKIIGLQCVHRRMQNMIKCNWTLKNARFVDTLMHLSIASPPPPPPGRPRGIWPLRFARGWGIWRWVTRVGHIDRRQSALWSPRVKGEAIWPFRLSPDGDLGYIWPPPWSKPHHLPGGGGEGYPGACNW